MYLKVKGARKAGLRWRWGVVGRTLFMQEDVRLAKLLDTVGERGTRLAFKFGNISRSICSRRNLVIYPL